ncbi:MAG: superoxide dismutase family protein [Alphaproteobacteria bacterium]|uniref:Superoxide dismutase [Cu-Zn] n=1 Tax=Candidatus Nitrobium versatile TaxID=2884831 RepID=A0A953JC27_9BACT|nr:superoxide dismutase family protein [Candidatus Nitrobium versatile]
MKKAALCLTAVLLLSGSPAYGESPLRAKAEMYNAQGEKIGTAYFTEAAEGQEGVKIYLKISRIPKGSHGFHIHETGRCDSPDFKSAGGHFNPHGKKHGVNNPEGLHAGDLPNITVDQEEIAVTVVTKQVTLKEGKNSLFQPGGTSLIIHAGPDDEMTDPAGNSGARIACGVITRPD